MSFPLLATRLLARSIFSASKLAVRHPPATQITRSFRVSSVAWARAGAATQTKAPTKKSPAKKTPTKKTAKKPAGKTKKAKKSLRAAKKPKKKVVKKKKVEKIRIRPEDRPPKRGPTNYGIFIANTTKFAQKPEGVDAKEFIAAKSREAAAAWKELSEEEKRSYSEQAAAALAEYKKKLEEYVKTTDAKIIKEINRRRVKSGKKRLGIRIGNPAISGYILYTQDERKKRPVPTSRDESIELVKIFGREWTALPDEVKQDYNKRAAAANAQRQKS